MRQAVGNRHLIEFFLVSAKETIENAQSTAIILVNAVAVPSCKQTVNKGTEEWRERGKGDRGGHDAAKECSTHIPKGRVCQLLACGSSIGTAN